MHYVRIVFFVGGGYDFDINDEQTLFQFGDAVCKVKVKRNNEEIKVIITFGGFEDRESADREGNKLFYNVKKQFTKKGIPINISGGLGVLDTNQKSFINGGITEYGFKELKKSIPHLANETLVNEILGMDVYQFDKDISQFTFVGQSVKVQLKTEFPLIEIEDYKQDTKLETAYSLLNSSNAINDLRASFILKVSAIESLVPEESYKSENYCAFIKQINNLITKENIKINIDISDTEKQKIIQNIKSSFGSLKKKSIGEKCKELIERCNFEKTYFGKNAISFFNECYIIRSEFVHTGTYINGISEMEKIRELENYKTELNRLIIDVLEFYEKNLI
ncbi:hypothetical protein LIS82_27395 (plasmid) [Cytobacillus solani]|uniref:hypothetical protein n=1 Tax=Cytobacillus solani TaxID=1637975 RepID=UPI00207A2865|nr:hypothetical protein [Cytobacillus solani]USK57706.1 hypothetical protein LIS82_27395 [Cytobacillus solani]